MTIMALHNSRLKEMQARRAIEDQGYEVHDANIISGAARRAS
jgi:hypothetical protein